MTTKKNKDMSSGNEDGGNGKKRKWVTVAPSNLCQKAVIQNYGNKNLRRFKTDWTEKIKKKYQEENIHYRRETGKI